MKQGLKRILSILCLLALVTGCLAAFAEDVSAEVTRIIVAEWKDEDNYEGLRPAQVTVSIGTQSAVLRADNYWTAELTAPADAKWAVQAIQGYDSDVRGTDVTTVTYSHSPAKTFLDLKVAWDDKDNAAKLRPEFVTVHLLADGKVFRTAVANSVNNWTASYTNLPVNRKGTTTPIVYDVELAEIPEGYSASRSQSTLTCKLLTGNLSVTIGTAGVPEGADISGLAVTISGPDPVMPVTLDAAANNTVTTVFSDVLPGAYLVTESNGDSLIGGYVMDAANSRTSDAVYVKAGEEGALNFSYAWKPVEAFEPNQEPLANADTLTIEILGPDPRLPMTVTYSQFTNGQYELQNLIPGSYVVVERNAETLVDTFTLTSKSITGLYLTLDKKGAVASLYNQYVPAPTPEPEAEFVDVPVAKIWNDNDNKDGNRPDSITVRLYADGVEVDSHVLTAAEDWEFTFTEKPRYQEDGKTEIVYTLNEDEVPLYVHTVNGSFITNDYRPEYTSAAVSKVWLDNNNEQKLRPGSIAVTLLPVNQVYVLNAANGWKTEVENLPTVLNGEPVQYSWVEQETVNYRRVGEVTEGNLTTFTNQVVQIPQVQENQPKPKTPEGGWLRIDDYDTALGMNLLINHVGDCFD